MHQCFQQIVGLTYNITDLPLFQELADAGAFERSDEDEEEFNVSATLSSFFRSFLFDMINFLLDSKEGTQNYGTSLLQKLAQGQYNLPYSLHRN